ncbi:hypothetical protein B0T21DRAFT_348744 [Apiosordaria backusii]|uniref:Uncharacterized protein n=1 Tax=Apiosordaria backusii TaxID=314023 RepID=A0AA40BM08_9PEZI|nr:hypothetical protein B0T21DRAFT_348744 [Apiosordaria backusii]
MCVKFRGLCQESRRSPIFPGLVLKSLRLWSASLHPGRITHSIAELSVLKIAQRFYILSMATRSGAPPALYRRIGATSHISVIDEVTLTTRPRHNLHRSGSVPGHLIILVLKKWDKENSYSFLWEWAVIQVKRFVARTRRLSPGPNSARLTSPSKWSQKNWPSGNTYPPCLGRIREPGLSPGALQGRVSRFDRNPVFGFEMLMQGVYDKFLLALEVKVFSQGRWIQTGDCLTLDLGAQQFWVVRPDSPLPVE